jgi:hypothetical protein
VTPAEITILRSLAAADVVTFIPRGTLAQLWPRFEGIVNNLRESRKAGRSSSRIRRARWWGPAGVLSEAPVGDAHHRMVAERL